MFHAQPQVVLTLLRIVQLSQRQVVVLRRRLINFIHHENNVPQTVLPHWGLKVLEVHLRLRLRKSIYLMHAVATVSLFLSESKILRAGPLGWLFY